jgi:hypothetical protein
MDLIGHKYESFVQKEIQKRAAAARKEVGVEQSRNSGSMGVLLCVGSGNLQRGSTVRRRPPDIACKHCLPSKALVSGLGLV